MDQKNQSNESTSNERTWNDGKVPTAKDYMTEDQSYPELHLHQLEEQVKYLSEKVIKLERENLEMNVLLEQAGISGSEVKMSETEYICLQQLRGLKEQSEARPLSKEEVSIVDLLHKNLLMARGIPVVKKTKEKKQSLEDLLKIVKSDK